MFSAFVLNVIYMQCSRLLKKSQKRLYWNFACSLKNKKKQKIARDLNTMKTIINICLTKPK